MNRDRWRRIEAICKQAWLLPAQERAALLEAKCGDDRELREEIEQILLGDSADLLASSADRGPAMQARDQPGSSPDDTAPNGFPRIPNYRVLGKLGEGGMGIVYVAEQRKPIQRRVAIKVIKLGMDTEEVVKRFGAERQALALMKHPSITQVFEAGATESGRPYFVMEHVAGVPISQHCDRQRLDVDGRLRLVQKVCYALDHAHSKGVIHRDIKPSNILVCFDGKEALPKIIDFGVAKSIEQRLVEQTLYTEYGKIVGTPEYMSPEQAEMTGQGVDHRTDVYSTGVLLYELLVGRLPIDADMLHSASYVEMQIVVRENEPRKPSTRLAGVRGASKITAARRSTSVGVLRRKLRGDLDWIALKAIAKDPAKRYQSAAAMADDIERYLHHQPVVARPPSIADRSLKLLLRYRVLLLTALCGLAIGGVGVSIALYEVVENATTTARDQLVASERRHAETERTRAEAATDMVEQAHVAVEAIQQELSLAEYRTHLAAAATHADENDVVALRRELDLCPAEHRGWEWRYLESQIRTYEKKIQPARSRIWKLQFDRLTQKVVNCSGGGALRSWDLADSTIQHFWTKPGDLRAFHLNADGSRLVSATIDGHVRLQEMPGGEFIETKFNASIHDVRFDASQQRLLLACSDSKLRVLRANDLASLFEIPSSGPRVLSVAVSPVDPDLIGITSGDAVQLWHLGRRELMGVIKTGQVHRQDRCPLLFSPDGKSLVTGGYDGDIDVWDLSDLTLRRVLRGHFKQVWDLAFCRDGSWLASVSGDRSLRLWDFETGDQLAKRIWRCRLMSVAISSDDAKIVAGTENGELVEWRTSSDLCSGRLHSATWLPKYLCYARLGSRLYSADSSGVLIEWDPQQKRPLRSYQCLLPLSVVASPSEELVLTGHGDGSVVLWDSDQLRPIQRIETGGRAIRSLAFDGSGSRLAVAGTSGGASVWELPTLAELHDGVAPKRTATIARGMHLRSIAMSSNGDRVAIGSDFGDLILYEVEDGRTSHLSDSAWAEVFVSFDPDGSEVAFAAGDGKVRIVDCDSGDVIRVLDAHSRAALTVSYSPDGRRLLTTGYDGLIKLWHSASGASLTTVARGDSWIWNVKFSPDGEQIAFGDYGGMTFFDAGTAKRASTKPIITESIRRAGQRYFESIGASGMLCSEIVDQIKTDQSLSEAMKRVTLRSARLRGDSHQLLSDRAWEWLSRDASAEQHRRAHLIAQDLTILHPKEAILLRTLGVAQYRLGDYLAARVTLKKAIELYHGPAAWPSVCFLAMTEHRLGDDVRARELLDQALATTPNPLAPEIIEAKQVCAPR